METCNHLVAIDRLEELILPGKAAQRRLDEGAGCGTVSHHWDCARPYPFCGCTVTIVPWGCFRSFRGPERNRRPPLLLLVPLRQRRRLARPNLGRATDWP